MKKRYSKRGLLALAVVCLSVGLAACGGGSGSGRGSGGADANANAGTASKELNIFMWSDYMSEDIVRQFEDEYGINVNFSYMNSSEEATAKIMMGGGDQYDLVMPCDADMTSLIEGGYLAEIDVSALSNFKNLGEAYTYRAFDPENKYAIPYLMNYVYVVYNKDTCPIEITRYADLLSPELERQISSVLGARNLFPIALASLGYDPNSREESEITEAAAWLTTYIGNVVYLNSDDPERPLISGSCSVAFVFDGQAGRAFAESDANLVVAELEDPIQLGVDELVIPANAANKENAMLFLDWLLDAEIMAENLQDDNPYTCPNVAAIALMDDDYRLNPAINIPEAMKANYYLQLDIGEAAPVYDRYYTELVSE
jgi:spermidine/putrescine transport system substrate-binding protein